MRSWSGLFGIAASVFLTGCVTDEAGQPATTERDAAGLVEAGRELAVRECASCHAIDQEMISPRPGVPPMRTLLSRYEPDMLANDFIEGVRVGHDEMPFFDFDIAAADALIAYLKSIDRNRAE
ncbi:MAG: c-type cytochrome [Alphaproteobacteria bacterium]|jgi:mono/diheme cytochrome c family protein|nr:MAG: c-type cytochrome [Alphaproteobacteria bacterium]